ncbi:cytochrome b/b6 domain-containing protein [Hoeflea sp. AS60]|uniref:cytochrome b/b6 domain-containing protein n=1 Tax=Hoeflea sp. AS60 TaxID=3135780 RepID=UPI00316CE88C
MSRHTFSTRIVHAGLAITIIANLALSLVMQGPHRDRPGDWLFATHQYVGLAALIFAFAFWSVMMVRNHGTDRGALFPWLVSDRRSALLNDLRAHISALRKLRLPGYHDHNPLASAVHGLGLLLMTAMAVTGSVYFAASWFGAQTATAVGWDLEIHSLLANLVWAYLIGHAGLALIHHYSQNLSLTEMWSLAPNKPIESK